MQLYHIRKVRSFLYIYNVVSIQYLSSIDSVLATILTIVNNDHVDMVGFLEINLPVHIPSGSRVGYGPRNSILVCYHMIVTSCVRVLTHIL